MALDEGISRLIGRIYESAYDNAQWESLLVALKDRFEACCVLQTISDLRHEELSRSSFYGADGPRAASGIAEYQAGHYKNDPTFQFAVRNPHSRYCATDEVIRLDEYPDHPFIRWNEPVLGSTHWVVGYTAPEDELTFGLSIHPPASVGPMSEERKGLFRMLFEHMDRAIRLATRPPLLSSERDAFILIDRVGAVRYVSPAAERLLAEADGLTVQGSSLQAADSTSSRRLDQMIASALSALRTGDVGGAVSLPRASGKRDLFVTVNPLLLPPSPFDAFRPAAILQVIDPDSGLPPSAADRWTALFGLTPAESRFAESLIGGDQNLRHTAESLGISYSTARVHLRQLFDKTSTHSQAQLARLLTKVE